MERSMQLPVPKHGGMMTPNGAHRALSANKQFSTRSCVRCEGLLVSERSYDLQNPDNPMAETLRCVQCGNRIDAVILQQPDPAGGRTPVQAADPARVLHKNRPLGTRRIIMAGRRTMVSSLGRLELFSLYPKDHAVRSPGVRGGMWLGFLLSICLPVAAAWATEPSTPEEVLRTLVRANAEKDIPTMSRWMAHDEDCINYTIGGRKYVGWNELAKDLQEEFEAVAHLEIPIRELQVWTRGEIAWFVMEIDYMRYSGQGPNQQLHVLPLRETGVLERRNGNWILVAWHESMSNPWLDGRRAEEDLKAKSWPE